MPSWERGEQGKKLYPVIVQWLTIIWDMLASFRGCLHLYLVYLELMPDQPKINYQCSQEKTNKEFPDKFYFKVVNLFIN